MRTIALGLMLLLSWTSFAAEPGSLQLFDGETLFGLKTEGDVSVKDGVLLLSAAKKPSSVTVVVPLPANGVFMVEPSATSKGFGQLEINDATSEKHAPYFAQFDQTAERLTLQSEVTTDTWNRNAKSSQMNYQGSIPLKSPLKAVRVYLAVSKGTLAIKTFTFTPAVGSSLFNGKDLTGWTLFKGEPKRELSKFDVTPAGELRVVNGPGDLRTDKAFSDFFLQFQCKTNGKNLNSGVFFRCIPEQYQNGYEAQIQNGYKDNDRTKPTDFGTGAIYRRIASRKVVSNDQEWFTMTVLAVGPRIRTWVNGYPTVDWLDERAADTNPRKGLRTAAGHFSIQGHDPTTDILFKGFTVHDLAK
jgi:hypothetical protein